MLQQGTGPVPRAAHQSGEWGSMPPSVVDLGILKAPRPESDPEVQGLILQEGAREGLEVGAACIRGTRAGHKTQDERSVRPGTLELYKREPKWFP